VLAVRDQDLVQALVDGDVVGDVRAVGALVIGGGGGVFGVGERKKEREKKK